MIAELHIFHFQVQQASTEIIDSVKGSWIEKVEPAPSVELIVIVPPRDSIVDFTTSNPTPGRKYPKSRRLLKIRKP